MKDFIRTFLNGFTMALADSVPGVSGGTIAFILGFYERFIGALDGLIFGQWPAKKQALKYLVKLGLGWATGMGLAVWLLAGLFDAHIYEVSSLFLGFIIAAIPVIAVAEKSTLLGNREAKTRQGLKLWQGLLFTLLGVVIVVLITFLGSLGGTNTVNTNHLDLGTATLMLLGGAVGISAMILPGISGSTLLLILGIYVPIVSGVRDILGLNFSSLPAILLFAIGVLLGAVLVVKLVKKALDQYRPQVVFTILGLMLGSIYAIIMGPTTLSEPLPALSFATFNILCFLAGIVIIIGIEGMKKLLSRQSDRATSPPAQNQD